ncbi:hypothetical protein [Sulfuriroseicoccus oceanibius]|uniref:Uncharacterized protein n=1 Tax=Sulfuriroseicoccus oceanibius TaxID=2707525 RepID=A0A6B3LFE9_9BACT|nr:hypothetical protein [Sulfuriroseicoccus oceanibius]QQL44415.1 hypothetical protein G3M56_011035 [Sulfuriroseicoccus oceanibius]
MTVTRRAFRKAVYAALAISVIGLALVCVPIVGPRSTGEFAVSWLPQILTGYAAMILVIEVVGFPLRSGLTKFWAGALFALAIFLVGVIAGSATSMVVYQDFDPHSYIVKPLYWLGIYGLIPALLIGFIGSAILRAAAKERAQLQE